MKSLEGLAPSELRPWLRYTFGEEGTSRIVFAASVVTPVEFEPMTFTSEDVLAVHGPDMSFIAAYNGLNQLRQFGALTITNIGPEITLPSYLQDPSHIVWASALQILDSSRASSDGSIPNIYYDHFF